MNDTTLEFLIIIVYNAGLPLIYSVSKVGIVGVHPRDFRNQVVSLVAYDAMVRKVINKS
jgi:hypothetical protein